MTNADPNQAAIRKLIDTFVDGWNAASGNRLASVFTENADFTAITGLHGRGRQIITEAHDEILATIYRGTTLSSEIELIDFFAPDAALVNAKFYLRKDGQSFFLGVTYTSCGIIAVRRARGNWRRFATWFPSRGQCQVQSNRNFHVPAHNTFASLKLLTDEVRRTSTRQFHFLGQMEIPMTKEKQRDGGELSAGVSRDSQPHSRY